MTDADILEIRDAHLPSQGETFGLLAFGHAVAAFEAGAAAAIAKAGVAPRGRRGRKPTETVQ